MGLIDFVLKRPVTVTVGVLLLVLFGLIGLGAIPVQLVPDVDQPIITVTTPWPGRTPQEVVEDVTKEQEEQLKNVTNLKRMKSVSREDGSEITLEFYLGSDISRALQEVSDALRRVPSYPDDVDEPTIKAADGASENAIAWVIYDLSQEDVEAFPDFDITTIQDALEDEVKPLIERIDGVAEVNIFGGREREARVLVDPVALAQRGLSYGQLASALRAENRNVSAGSVAEGRRDFRVRVTGQFLEPRDVLDTVIAWRDGGPVKVRDVAEVEIGYQKKRGFVRSLGHPSVAMNVIRQSNANVLDIMTELRTRLGEVQAEILPSLTPPGGPRVRLRQVYDETTYLDSAIRLVVQNLWIGGAFAGLVLFGFLRNVRTTAVIMLAIPISVIGTFLVLLGLGRTINVISLAGLAFAVGMVVDNAIVVLENIYRRLQEGDSAMHAAGSGARQVWGAILASTLTTVAVFVPVLTIQEEAGQLFKDISLAVVASVSFSLIVSITVIPTACSRLLRPAKARHAAEGHGRLARLSERIETIMLGLVSGRGSVLARPLIVVALTAASLLGAWLLAPPLDYLPAGNRNLVFGGLLIPPGQSVDQREATAHRIEDTLRPYVEADTSEPSQRAELEPIPRRDAPDRPFDPVGIENFFIGSFRGSMFVGATSQDAEVVLPVGTLLTNAMNGIPDAFGGARQRSIFGRGAGGGNSIDVEISGPKLERVVAAAGALMGSAGGRYGFANVRPDPSNFNLQQPEWRLRLKPAGRELGLTTADLGLAVRSLVDGSFVDDYPWQGRTIDLTLLPEGGQLRERSRLLDVPIATPAGRIVPLDLVAEIVPGLAPQEIQRIEELPAVTIGITPPESKPLETVMAEIQDELLAPLREGGLIDPSMRVRLEGTAAKLDEVKAALFGHAAGAGLDSWWRKGLAAAGLLVVLAGVLAALRVLSASGLGGQQRFLGVAGAVAMGLILGALPIAVAFQPQLLTARFVWALLVTYLLMCALFESFLYPLVIMFSVPLAVVGGFAGLALVHGWTLLNPERAPQQLDVLTMLGFIILIGVVVNNAILLVHRALQLIRGEAEGEDLEPMAAPQAIAMAVRNRLRPILMSTLTSVGGMLPLVLFPGSGSEMYRGLGSVVVGGLLVSTFFTLILVPLVFSLVLDMAAVLEIVFKGRAAEERASAPVAEGGAQPAPAS